MEISKKHLYNHLHDIAIDQIIDEYESKGYTVKSGVSFGEYTADILATKDNEKIIIEVKAGKLDSQSKRKLAELADYVNSQDGYKFKIVVARPPRHKSINIENLTNLLQDFLVTNTFDSLANISIRYRIDRITDIEVQNLSINQNESINVTGQGVVDVEFQFGSDKELYNDNGYILTDSFPFDFDVKLSYNASKELEIAVINSINIDTSSYYG